MTAHARQGPAIPDGQSELAVAASSLTVAALFQPARHRTPAAVDRCFAGSRHKAAKTVEAFSGRLRDQIDLDTLCVELLATDEHPTSDMG